VLQVALATAAQLPDLDEDGAALLEALDAEGVQAAPVVWDSGADWAAYDLVVVRSTWDYDRRREQFLAWAASVPRLANPADVLAWNTDKTYLQALASAGVPVVETTWLVPGDVFTPPAGPYVVKPTVSAGARDTAAYDGGADATAHVQRLLAAGRPVMVQPYLPQVDVLGETSVLCFEGEVSHAASKSALLQVGAGVRNDIDSRAFVTPAEPTRAQVRSRQGCPGCGGAAAALRPGGPGARSGGPAAARAGAHRAAAVPAARRRGDGALCCGLAPPSGPVVARWVRTATVNTSEAPSTCSATSTGGTPEKYCQ